MDIRKAISRHWKYKRKKLLRPRMKEHSEAEVWRGLDENILPRPRRPKDPKAETIRILRNGNNMPMAR
jgi:hypothetical protein